MTEGKRNLNQFSDAEWTVAENRERVIRPLVSSLRVGTPAANDAAKQLSLSQSHIYELIARYRENPVASSLIPRKRGQKKGNQRLPNEVEVVIQSAIEDFFLTRQKPNLTNLRKYIRQKCVDKDLKPPSDKAVRARVSSINLKKRVKKREGQKAADDLFRPVRTTYDEAKFALDIVQIDHTLADVIVVDEVYRQPLGRPWLTIAIDIASRMVAGLYVTLEKPSTVSVAMVLRNIVLPKEKWLLDMGIEAPWPVSGLPNHIHLDNAKEFRSHALNRGCREYGIDIQYRPVRRPHYGGHIERLIGTMMGAVHLLPGTTFSNIFEKGDYDSEKQAVMTLTEFETWLTIQVVGVYHAEIHRGLSIPPNTAWDDAMGRRDSPIRMPKDSEQFLYDFLPSENRMVRRDGIRLFNIHYWDNVLSIWAGQTKHAMPIKYDPRNLSQIYLQDPDGIHWPIRYRNLRRPEITLWEHRQAVKALRERGRRSIDEQIIFDAIEAQRMLITEAKSRTKEARKSSQRTAYALESLELSDDQNEIKPQFEEEDQAEDFKTNLLPFDVEEWS